MGLLSIFKRRADSSAGASASVSDSGDAVQRARTRARQRLIGAVVLVGVGIVGFPLVFETQPRPIPVDIPIDIPRKDGAPALVMPARAPATMASRAPGATDVPAAPNDVITESREEAGREVAVPASSPSPAQSAASKKAVEASNAESTAKAAQAKTEEPKPATQVATSKPSAASKTDSGNADAAKARALLDGKPAAATAETSSRFVVQVGAFSDANAARETRVKAEKLGLKTYTQVASTPAGERIRVRVGPFASRDDADKALAKARSAGLVAVVLTL